MDIEEFLNSRKSKNLSITNKQANELIEANQLAEYFVGEFNFLKEHKSLRRGKKHLLLGTAGSGKSTLARAVAFNIARKQKIMWYSSEESYDDMITALSFSKELPESLCNVEFRDEAEFIKTHGENVDSFLSALVKDFIESGCEVLFFDNITTSNFYEMQKLDIQKKFFMRLSNVFVELNKPLFLVAHTSSGVKDLQGDLFTATDIRGGKMPALKCEYIYAYQIINWASKKKDSSKYNVGEDLQDNKTAFVRVLKSRQHNNGGCVYRLDYDNNKRKYVGDKKINFCKFKDVYDLRLKLK